MTVSIGAAVSPTSTAGMDSPGAEADRTLYAAKRAGRNRVRSTSDVPDTVDWSIWNRWVWFAFATCSQGNRAISVC